jgi:predicted nucleic acid binding AN1-type Zn finger protein
MSVGTRQEIRNGCAKCNSPMGLVKDVPVCCDCGGKKVATVEDEVMSELWRDLRGLGTTRKAGKHAD